MLDVLLLVLWSYKLNLSGRQVFENERVVIPATIDGEILTNMSILQTTLELIPILFIHNISLQPMREISNPILTIPYTRNLFPHPSIGDKQSKHSEESKSQHKQECHQKVTIECRVDSEQRSRDSKSRHNHDEYPAD